MAEFLRSEARDALWRFRELLLGGAVAMLGLWWAMTTFGIMIWVGWALVILGGFVVYVAVQRLRFARGGGGAGVVEVNERRVAYLGPLTGGVVDLDDLTLLELDPGPRPPHWRLYTGTQVDLSIPVDAEGADLLFDAFAALPGLRTERMLDALNKAPKERVAVWQSATYEPPKPRLLH